MKIDQYCQRQHCKHVELEQFVACFRVARICQRQLGFLVQIHWTACSRLDYRQQRVHGQRQMTTRRENVLRNKLSTGSQLESCAAARKPRDAAAVVLFCLKFADDIHYKLARLHTSKHTALCCYFVQTRRMGFLALDVWRRSLCANNCLVLAIC